MDKQQIGIIGDDGTGELAKAIAAMNFEIIAADIATRSTLSEPEPFIVTAPPLLPEIMPIFKGQGSARRERRKRERQMKKKRK